MCGHHVVHVLIQYFSCSFSRLIVSGLLVHTIYLNMIRPPVLCLFTFLVLVSCVDQEEISDKKNKGKLTQSTNSSNGKIVIVCDELDTICKRDNISLGAIYEIHHLIDDDMNGNVDQSESDEFMRDELQYTEGFERLSIFHGNDKFISVSDLWQAWKKSKVYNWTVEDVSNWLVKHVELSQYVATFKKGNIDGKILPSLAIPNNNFTKNVLGIKNAIHRQKISVKAMDLVLFGPPKEKPNYVKDFILVLSLVVALGGCWFAYVQHKYSKKRIKKMMEEMESLTKIQEKLEEAEEKQLSAYKEKENLEMRYQDEIDLAKREADKLRKEREEGKTEENLTLQLAEQELDQMRAALLRAEKELARKTWSPPLELQAWLQFTFETEQIYFNLKKQEAERQLEMAKDECRKIQRKRATFLGPLRMAPGNSIDMFDHKIEHARLALEEVRHSLMEKSQRWQQIEKLCGFSITCNPGREKLAQTLNRDTGTANTSYGTVIGSLNVDEGELDEDPNFAMFYQSTSMANGFTRQTSYTGYQGLRQRPKNFAGSSNALSRNAAMGSTGSLSRVGHPPSIASKLSSDAFSPSSAVSEFSSLESPESDLEHPVFSLDESSPDSPGNQSTLVIEKNQHSDTNSNNIVKSGSPMIPEQVSKLYNSNTLPRSRTATDTSVSGRTRDSVGNTSLPASVVSRIRDSTPPKMPKSASDANLSNRVFSSLENKVTDENITTDKERQNNKKKRSQFLKIFGKKHKSS